MLPEHLTAVLDAKTWEVPEVLKWLKKSGNLTEVREFDCLRSGFCSATERKPGILKGWVMRCRHSMCSSELVKGHVLRRALLRNLL